MRKTHPFLRCALAATLACGLMVPTAALTAFADEEKSPTPPLATDVDAGEPAARFGSAAPDADEGSSARASFKVGTLTVTGANVSSADFEVTSSAITIKTSEPFTISGTSAVGLVVPAGVKAHMTLDNITVSAAWAFDIKAGGEAHLILADNSANSFTSTNTQAPGIHCGTGAVFTVDDSVPNVDTSGKLITPDKGQIPAGTKYVDNTGRERVSQGDYLTLLDSPNRGSLYAKGGGMGSALGGADAEDGGTMTFNGGRIEVLNGGGPNTDGSGGAGIGGGRNAAGTSPSEWITVNGGWITSNASFHGAGFGGGWNTGAASAPSGLTVSAHPGGTGNIRINGGYVESNGGADGNGFGRGCYGNQKNCDNRDYTIIITGGTMIPHGGTNLTEPWGNDIGGAGTTSGSSSCTDSSKAATVIVSGGSVYVSKRKDGVTYRFDGVAYGSYTETEDGAIIPNKTDQVVPITINLSKDLEDLTPEGQTPDLNRTITSWDLLVGGEKVGYGAPAQFNEGYLYLWLTPQQADQQVTVQLTYLGDDGKPVPVEPLYRPAGGTGGDTNLKRYVFFDLQQDFFEDKNGGTGEALVSYDCLSSYEQRKYKDAVDANGMVKVPVVKKAYNGLEYQVKELTDKDNSINSGGDDNKPIWDKISYLCQVYDAKTGKLGAEMPSDTTPVDTGLTRFTMTSTQYSDEPQYKDSYYGHRAYGWCEITPVPAVVKISEDNGAAWVRLAADGSYEVVKETDKDPGTHLRLAFDIRSAKGTAVTCKAPTGSFQVMIDGKPVGEPIALPADAFKAGAGKVSFKDADGKDVPGSTIEVVAGDEGRETTRVLYYLDPANLDGALDALASDAATNTHEVTVRYVPDKNYVEGTEDNPQNEATQPTPIIPVKPEGEVTPDDPDKVEIGDSPKPEPGPDGNDPDDPTGKMQVVRKTITASYGDFHQEGDDAISDFFKMALTSNSSAPSSFSVSNTAVADLVRGADGKPLLDENGRLQIQVNSCGTTVITVEQKANALFTGIKYILTVNITPDPTIRPKIQIRLTWRNLTAIEEATGTPAARLARALVAAPADAGIMPLAVRATTDRTHTPPRPGDRLEYTVTGLNLTPGSAWQAAELRDAIDQRLTFDAESVAIAPNYATHSDQTQLGSDAFYAGFDWDGLAWADVDAGDFSYVAPELTKGIGTVYGGQSTSVRFCATVGEDEGLGDRPGEDGKLPEITNTPSGEGGYGKPEGDLKPGETPTDPKPLDPDKDIEIVGDGEPDPVTGKPPAPAPLPVLPKDPAAADIVTTVKVEQTGHTEEHDGDRFMVGDTLTVTATSTNKGPDSKLSNAIIKVTLPVGMEPKEGTLKLTDALGNTYDVPMSAYDPKTGVIAVNAGDLYFNDKAVLTFDVEVISTSETRDPSDPGTKPGDPDAPGTPGDPDSPGTPGNPDDPSNPGGPTDPSAPGPTRPEGPAIEGGTLGETPTDEWEREHPTDPDVEPADPADKPRPGTPFEPGKPWEDLEDEFVTTPPVVDPDMPPVLPSNPKLEDDEDGPADIKVAKAAENLDRADGTTHVGDAVRYTITLSNAKQHSMWYDAVIRDRVPEGLEPLSESIKVIGADGVERAVPDDAYDPETRVLAVAVGDVAGGRSAVLVFDALVTEEAIGSDVGNVADAFGTRPSDVVPGEVAPGVTRPTPGVPFVPEEGWDAFDEDHPSISNPAPTYPSADVDGAGGVKPADPTGDGSGASGGSAGDGSGGGAAGGNGKDSRTPIRLAQTGDETLGMSVALVMAAAAGGLMLTAATAQRRRQREALIARHRGQW